MEFLAAFILAFHIPVTVMPPDGPSTAVFCGKEETQKVECCVIVSPLEIIIGCEGLPKALHLKYPHRIPDTEKRQ